MKEKSFTRKILLEICISFLKESWKHTVSTHTHTHTHTEGQSVCTNPQKYTDKYAETNKTDRSSTQGERDQSTQQYSQKPPPHPHTPVNVATRPLEWVHPPLGQTHYCHWAEEFGIYYRTPEKERDIITMRHGKKT